MHTMMSSIDLLIYTNPCFVSTLTVLLIPLQLGSEDSCSALLPLHGLLETGSTLVGSILLERCSRYDCGSAYVQPRRMLVKSDA
jgi:hypothetical protein